MNDRVVAVVLTYNRRDRLDAVFAAIRAQTHRPEEVLVIDNASTDGSFEHLETLSAAMDIPVRVVRLIRNGGSAEGYHYALSLCLDGATDWAWIVEDDLVPAPDALAILLASPHAADVGTAALASAIESPDGGLLLVPRGTVRARYSGTPCRPVPAERYGEAAIQLDYFGFLGSLIRLNAVRVAGLPRRDMLGWIDDVEFSWRLSQTGDIWLVPASRVLHDDGSSSADFGAGLRDRLRRLRHEPVFAHVWRNAYGLRNLLAWGRAAGLIRGPHALCYWAILCARAMIFAPDLRWRRVRIYTRMSIDGWRGCIRSVAPSDWVALGSNRGSVASYLDRHAVEYGPLSELVAHEIRNHVAPTRFQTR